MNKKIIAIAIASAMAAPVAMADVTVSGQVGGHLTFAPKEVTTNQQNAGKAHRDFGDAGASKITFDGTMGDAYVRVGMQVTPMFGGGSETGRDVYMGYNLGGGTSIQAGRMAGVAQNLEKDPYIATFLESRKTAAEAYTQSYFGNSGFIGSLIQVKAKVGGMTLTGQYDPTDNFSQSSHNGHIGLSLAGAAGAVNYWVSYNNGDANGQGTTASTNQTNTKVGAAMKMGAAKITVAVSDADFGTKSAGNKSTSTLVMGDFGMGNGLSLNAAYGSNGDKGTWMRAAVAKELNKGAKLYAGATSSKAAGAGATSVTVMGAGMIVKF